MKRRFELSNIPSTNIYKQIIQEIELKALRSKVKLNDLKHTITIEASAENIDSEVEIILEIVREIAPNLEINELEMLLTHRRILILKNLDCANCAAKIERIAQRTLNYEFLVVDFASTRFIIETSDQELINNLEEKVYEITKQVDANIVIENKSSAQKPNISKKEQKVNKILFISGFIIYAVSLILHYLVFSFVFDENGFNKNDLSNLVIPGHLPLVIMYGVAYLSLGGDVLMGALRNIKSGRFFDEKFLMSIATIMAFIIGSFTEAVSVMLFYKIGELLQEYAVNSSRRSIAALMDIKPASATMIVEGNEMVVDPLEIAVDDIIIVKPGERIPLDGEVIEGEAALDTSALTGESKYFEVKEKDIVISGAINTNGYLKIKVSKTFENSTVAKILDLVSNASANKAKTENFVSKFAKYYTPVVCALAALIIVFNLLFFEKSTVLHDHIRNSVYPAMIFLVVSCPCALVISVPLGFFGGLGGASKKGILIKGSNYLEQLGNAGMIIFDKTGTLTKGTFMIRKIVCKESSKEDVLKYAAYCEVGSIHPIAKSIVESYGHNKIDFNKIKYLSSPSKKGNIIELDNIEVAAGNFDFMKEIQIKVPHIKTTGLVVYVALNKKYFGYIVLEDIIRKESKQTIETLHKMGLKVAMVTGDSEDVTANVAEKLGIDLFFSNSSAIDKVKRVRKLKKEFGIKKVVFIGDGINDAPVLGNADVGIAMGAFGSDAAIEVADIVLMTDELSKIPEGIVIARKTKRIVIENIVFALAVKVIFMIMAIFNSNMWIWEAVFADVGVSLIAILNSLRAANLSLKDITKGLKLET